eukprot:scaffold269796_cov27-Tisochrysis_lutea.AAC.1
MIICPMYRQIRQVKHRAPEHLPEAKKFDIKRMSQQTHDGGRRCTQARTCLRAAQYWCGVRGFDS